MGILITYSCNLFMPSGSAQAQSPAYHFHLMIEHCCACPALWLDRLGNTQFIIGNSGCMVTWCPMVKGSVSTNTPQQTQSCFSKGNCLSVDDSRALLQNPKDLCCNLPIGVCQRSQTASVSATDPSRITGSSGSWAQVAEQLAQQLMISFCCL